MLTLKYSQALKTLHTEDGQNTTILSTVHNIRVAYQVAVHGEAFGKIIATNEIIFFLNVYFAADVHQKHLLAVCQMYLHFRCFIKGGTMIKFGGARVYTSLFVSLLTCPTLTFRLLTDATPHPHGALL